MRHLIVLIALTLPQGLAAQERVITPSGRTVLLYPNGTWKYADSSAATAPSAAERKRPATSTARLDLLRGKASLYYDATKWRVAPTTEPGRSQLQHVDGDGYAIVIAERLQMPLEGLRDLALNNARNAAPDAQIVSQETRRVNGRDVMVLQIRGTLQAIRFVYLGYYYAGPEGTIQLLTYTAANLFDEYKPQFEQLLDGLTINQ